MNAEGTSLFNVGTYVERLQFMGIYSETLDYVRAANSYIQPHKEAIVNQFYEQVTDVVMLDNIIQRHSTLERLRQTLSVYLEQFLQADVNEEYIKTRVVVGQVHSRIRLTAEHFISAHHLLIQAMTSIVMERMYAQPEKMMKTVLAIQRLGAFDQQLIVEVYMEDTFRAFLFGISNTLNDVSNLETSKQLIDSMNVMNDESQNVSSATEQVSASILEVAKHATNVAESTDDAVSSAEKSKRVVNETLHDIQKVGHVYDDVAAQVSQLNDEIEKTNEVVEMIRQITEQTNLLALNASIEAARAGEHGKGFAVVADEVRKLAEHTKEQTEHIVENMVALQHVSKQLTEQMSATGERIEKSVSGANMANEALEMIVRAMYNINSSTSQIAAMSEEQTSAVEEIAKRNSLISELSKDAQDVALQTANTFFELSNQLEEYRDTYFETNIQLSDQDMLKMIVTDHLLLKWKVYNVLLGVHTVDEEESLNEESCRYSLCFREQLSAEVTENETFAQLESVHTDVHAFANAALHLYESGKLADAKRAYEQLDEASEQLITTINDLQS